jgi:hypothetical protein
MSLRAFGRPVPSTPARRNQIQGVPKADEIIATLNREYNLGLQFCDKSLTTSHRRERAKVDLEFARYDQIFHLLQQVVFKGGQRQVIRALHAFHREAKAACRNWKSKPGHDRGIITPSPLPHKASTPGEQSELQDIFLDILKQVRQTVLPLPTTLPKSDTETHARDGVDNGFAIPSRPFQQATQKRTPDEALESPPKRVRVLAPDEIATAIDNVATRESSGRDNPSRASSISHRDARRPLGRSISDVSANTSNTSNGSKVPSIFSSDSLEPLPISPSTLGACSRQSSEALPLLEYASQSPAGDTFAPSSADIIALNEALLRHVERGEDLTVSDRYADTHTPDESGWPAARYAADLPGRITDYTDCSGSFDQEMGEISPPVESSSLEARLTKVWRMSKSSDILLHAYVVSSC